MLKHILSLILSLLLLQAVKAENPDSLIVYLKNSGQEVKTKDSADYYRIILPPDTNMDRDLYRVCDYYLNGKPKRFAKSLTKTRDTALDGVCLNYFPNGKRKSNSEYKNGRLIGTMTNYYPNGKLYYILNVEDLTPDPYNRYYTGYSETPWYGYKLKIAELRDSTGNLLVEKGTGHVVAFDDDFKKSVGRRGYKNNKKEGEWRGPIADSGKFICVYHNDKLKSGVSYMKSGSHYNFKQLHTDAVFKDGIAAFQLFIRNNLQFPESAKKHNVSGSVSVGFFIEPNGSLSEIKVVKSLVKSVDDEAIRVINLSPLWIPATEYGISIRTYQWVPVYFFNL